MWFDGPTQWEEMCDWDQDALWKSFLEGYCSTVQGLLDWFEVDLGFTELSFIQIDLCVVCDWDQDALWNSGNRDFFIPCLLFPWIECMCVWEREILMETRVHGVCGSVGGYVYIYTRVHTLTHTYTCIYVYTCVYIWINIQVHMRTMPTCTHVCTYK